MLRFQSFGRTIHGVPILEKINLELSGGIVCLLGPNGAGKTTFLATLVAPFPHYQGESFYQSPEKNDRWVNLRNTTERRLFLTQCSYLGHEPGLFYDLSVEENLDFFHKISEPTKKQTRRQCKENRVQRINFLLEQTSLATRRTQTVRSLSRGLKQQLGLLRCFLHRPKILFMDEPLSSLDEVGRHLLCTLLKQARENRCLVIVASHEKEFFEKNQLANRYLFLKRGHLVADIPSSRYNEIAKKKLKEILHK